MAAQTQQIPAEWWSGEDGSFGPELADLTVERDEVNPGKIAIHTFVDGAGSKSSYYLGREDAIRFAHQILKAVVLR